MRVEASPGVSLIKQHTRHASASGGPQSCQCLARSCRIARHFFLLNEPQPCLVGCPLITLNLVQMSTSHTLSAAVGLTSPTSTRASRRTTSSLGSSSGRGIKVCVARSRCVLAWHRYSGSFGPTVVAWPPAMPSLISLVMKKDAHFDGDKVVVLSVISRVIK